jgi:hypothetical protein
MLGDTVVVTPDVKLHPVDQHHEPTDQVVRVTDRLTVVDIVTDDIDKVTFVYLSDGTNEYAALQEEVYPD